MKLLMYGVNKDTVMKEDTEKYFLDKQNRKKQIQILSALDGVEEIAVLSNNFRNEYYLYVDEGVFSHGEFLRYIAEETDKPLEEIILETYSKFNGDVIRHLYEIATGFIAEPMGSITALASVEDAFHFSKELNTMGDVITRMFQSAIDIAFELKLDESVKPLNQTDLSRYIYLLKEKVESLAKKHFMISGSDLDIYFLTKVLLKAEAQSVSIIQTDEKEAQRQYVKIKACLSDIDQTKVYPVTAKSLYYRLSKVDMAIFNTDDIELFDETIIEEVKIIRQTKKVQYLIDTSDSEPVHVEELDLDLQLIPLKTDFSYTEDEMTTASVSLDETLSANTKVFMDYLEELQMNQVEEKLIF